MARLKVWKDINLMNRYNFGVEIECVVDKTNTHNFIDRVQRLDVPVGGDGSIRYGSGYDPLELKTPPTGLIHTGQIVTEIEKLARLCNAEVNDSCGLHVHTSNPKFIEDKNLRKILGVWVAIEDVMFATQPESRLNSSYCKRRLASYAVAGFPKLPKSKQALVDELGQSDRYYALNFASLSRHGTLECRLHAGTLSAEKIINWIKLLQAFFDYALNSYNSKDVNELFIMPTSEEKVSKVWKLLGLNKELRNHFNNRIEKFMLPLLAKQHDTAQKILKHRMETTKEQENIQKMITKGSRMEDEAREKLNKAFQKIAEKAKIMIHEGERRKVVIMEAQKQLLREFVGNKFEGNLSNMTHPWQTQGELREDFYDIIRTTDSTRIQIPSLDSFDSFTPIEDLVSATEYAQEVVNNP